MQWMTGWELEPVLFALIGFILLCWLAYAYDPDAIAGTAAAVVALSPIWLPIYLFVFFWTSWMEYIRLLFWFSQEHVLLEIQLPQTVEKSPLAMEAFLTTLWNAGGEATFITRMWKGSFRAIWSLEIACNEGRLGFYIHTREGWRNIIEARLYGQFPEAKIIEVDDYAARIPFNLDEYNLFGNEYYKGAATDALPIKTYVDYAMDQAPDKPEIQVDPLVNVLEVLGQIGPGEHFWMQIICKAYKKDEWYGFYLTTTEHKEKAAAAVKNIIKGAADRTASLVSDEAAKKQVASRGPSLLTEEERNQVNAIERWLTKLPFECGIRVVYLGKKEQYVGINAGAIVRFFDTFRSPLYNALGASGRGAAGYDYPWQDFMDIRKKKERRLLFQHYKERAYFYVPYDQKPVYMNTEELATLWHFPSAVVQTPGLNRVPSRRAEAPVNLPVG